MPPLVVSLTMDEALDLGIVKCAHCGYPPNNHFANGKCAFDPRCPGYVPKFRMGTAIPQEPVDPNRKA